MRDSRIKLACRTILLFCISTAGFSQVQLSLSSGYSTYSMSQLKEFQTEMKSQFPVEAKITSSFPGYIYHEFSGAYQFGDHFLSGISLTYGSTGGKIHYRDYSGEMGNEQVAKYFEIGLPLSWKIPLQENKLNMHLQLRPSWILGNLSMSYESEINSKKAVDEVEFKSTNVGFQPSVMVERKIGPLFLFLSCAYNQNVYKSKLFFKENDDYYLLNSKFEKVRADWSGLRVGLGVSYTLVK